MKKGRSRKSKKEERQRGREAEKQSSRKGEQESIEIIEAGTPPPKKIEIKNSPPIGITKTIPAPGIGRAKLAPHMSTQKIVTLLKPEKYHVPSCDLEA